MSQLYVDNIKNRDGGAIAAPSGAIVTGVVTATTFKGNVDGTTGTFSGNVSVDGVLTYDDVANVDSIGIVTAQSGIRVGAGESIGSTTSTENVVYYGDGSNLTGVDSGSANFVATGTISNGATVIIKTDGTVSIVTQTGSDSPSANTPVTFGSSATEYISAAYDSTNNKVIIVYYASSAGTAIVGTVSGTTITFGTAVQFNSSFSAEISVAYDSTNEKVVIAYKDGGNSNYGTSIVGTVSGTSISFGTPVVFFSGGEVRYTSTVFDSTNGKVVIAYSDYDNSSHGRVRVGTVSGTSISFGTEAVFHAGGTYYTDAIYDSANGKVVIAYMDSSNSYYGTAIVGTVSGTDISFGTEVVFNSGTIYSLSAAYDSTNEKVVIGYRDAGNSNYGTAIVGTVSGTSISFGSEVVFNSAASDQVSCSYDSTSNRILISFRDDGNSYYGTAIVGTVSGTSISFGSEVVFESDRADAMVSVPVPGSNKVIIAYQDYNDSQNGKALVFNPTAQVTNLTTENYIGIAAEAISNGATGKVNIMGGVNSGQTGLTTARTYYVQPDGTLATSAGSPSVVAGTSISETQILIR